MTRPKRNCASIYRKSTSDENNLDTSNDQTPSKKCLPKKCIILKERKWTTTTSQGTQTTLTRDALGELVSSFVQTVPTQQQAIGELKNHNKLTFIEWISHFNVASASVLESGESNSDENYKNINPGNLNGNTDHPLIQTEPESDEDIATQSDIEMEDVSPSPSRETSEKSVDAEGECEATYTNCSSDTTVDPVTKVDLVTERSCSEDGHIQFKHEQTDSLVRNSSIDRRSSKRAIMEDLTKQNIPDQFEKCDTLENNTVDGMTKKETELANNVIDNKDNSSSTIVEHTTDHVPGSDSTQLPRYSLRKGKPKTSSDDDEFECDIVKHDVKPSYSIDTLVNQKCDICSAIFKTHRELKDHRKQQHSSCVSECDVCGMQFFSRSKMIIHRRRHTGEKPYTCRECGSAYLELSTLRKHIIRTKHKHSPDTFVRRKAGNIKSTMRKLPCQLCGKVLSKLSSLRTHMATHEGAKCNRCRKRFTTEEKLELHVPNCIASPGKKRTRVKKFSDVCPICEKRAVNIVRHRLTHLRRVPFMCKICSLILDSQELLDVHLKGHPRSELYICDTCGKAFGTKGRLNDHKRMHKRTLLEKRKLYTCSTCNIGFFCPEKWQNHNDSHSNNTAFKCPDLNCEESFTAVNDIKAHLFTHSGDNSPVNCRLCDKLCSTKHQLARHRIKKHRREQMCNICGKLFPTNIDLNRHMSKHTGKFDFHCEVCQKGFFCPKRLAEHMHKHSDKKPFSCEHCGCTFAIEFLLKRHLLQHNSDSGFLCKSCNLSFADQVKLDHHLKLHKKKKSAITCTTCGLAFADSRYRRNHMRSVHGQKDFVCNICRDEFNCRLDLVNHRFREHGPSSVYTCKVCSKLFLLKVDLTVHSRIHNKIERAPFAIKTEIKRECTVVRVERASCAMCGKDVIIQNGDISGGQITVCSECQNVAEKKSEHVESAPVTDEENILIEIPAEFALSEEDPSVLTCVACDKTFVLFENFMTHMQEHPELQIKIETVE